MKVVLISLMLNLNQTYPTVEFLPNWKTVFTVPVSYTHLDVYKRQGRSNLILTYMNKVVMFCL